MHHRAGMITPYVIIGLILVMMILIGLYLHKGFSVTTGGPSTLDEQLRQISSPALRQDVERLAEHVSECAKEASTGAAKDLADTAFADILSPDQLITSGENTYPLLYDSTLPESNLLSDDELQRTYLELLGDDVRGCVEESSFTNALQSSMEPPPRGIIVMTEDGLQTFTIDYSATLSYDERSHTLSPMTLHVDNDLADARASIEDFISFIREHEFEEPSETERRIAEQLTPTPRYNLAFLAYEPDREMYFELGETEIFVTMPVYIGDDERLVRFSIRPYEVST